MPCFDADAAADAARRYAADAAMPVIVAHQLRPSRS